MKILFINNFFNPGGSTLACLELAKAMPKSDELTFVGCYLGSLIGEFTKLGRVFYGKGPFPQFDYNFQALYEFNGKGDIFNIFQIIEEVKPDVIHVFIPGHENPSFFAQLKYIDCVKVCTVLCGQKVGFDTSIFDKVVFPSEYNKNLSELHNGEVVRYGIEHDISLEALTHKRLIGREPTNIKFGRISAFCPSKKILDTVLCAVNCPDNQFIIGGEIQDYTYYQQVCGVAKNAPNVTIYPDVSDKKKREILDEIDVLHYPSSNEAFCYSILEGMRLGMPVITYPSSSILEFTKDKIRSGFLFAPVDNISELSRITKDFADKCKADMTMYQQLGYNNFVIYTEEYMAWRYARDIKAIYDQASQIRTQRKSSTISEVLA